jgi:hypothetical protein
MDIGISVVPKHSGSEPVGQIRGFPAMLREKEMQQKIHSKLAFKFTILRKREEEWGDLPECFGRKSWYRATQVIE